MNRLARREAQKAENRRLAERRRKRMPLHNTDTVTIGDDLYKVRELSVVELQEADEQGTERAFMLIKLLPEDVVKEEIARQRAEGRDEAGRGPRYESYNPATLLKYGLVGWSHEEPCDDAGKSKLGVSRGEILARRIFELSTMLAGEVVRSSMKSLTGESQDGQGEPTDSTMLPDGLPSETTSAPQPVS